MNKEIIWNIINSLLAGALVFLGALTDGEITSKGVCASIIAAGIIAIVQFKTYWEKEEEEYKVIASFHHIILRKGN